MDLKDVSRELTLAAIERTTLPEYPSDAGKEAHDIRAEIEEHLDEFGLEADASALKIAMAVLGKREVKIPASGNSPAYHIVTVYRGALLGEGSD